MDEYEEARAALEQARERRDRHRAELDEARDKREGRLAEERAALDEAQRAIEEASGELERLDRVIEDVPRRERILASPMDFPDTDLAAIVAGLPAARVAAIEARNTLPRARARHADAIAEYDEVRRRVRKAKRKVRANRKEANAVEARLRAAEERLRAADLVRRRRRVNGIVVALLVIGALVAGYYVLNWVGDVGERRPGRAVGIAAAFAVVGLAGVALMRYRDRADSLLDAKGAWPVLLWVGVFVAYPAGMSFSAHQHGSLSDYCNYGVVSRAQFEGCMHHASMDAVEHSESNAARFARGELEDCLSDAGPYCAQALAYHSYADQVDSP